MGIFYTSEEKQNKTIKAFSKNPEVKVFEYKDSEYDYLGTMNLSEFFELINKNYGIVTPDDVNYAGYKEGQYPPMSGIEIGFVKGGKEYEFKLSHRDSFKFERETFEQYGIDVV